MYSRRPLRAKRNVFADQLLEDSKHGWLPALHIKNMPADMHQGKLVTD